MSTGAEITCCPGGSSVWGEDILRRAVNGDPDRIIRRMGLGLGVDWQLETNHC
jgi:hypothetical protein